MKRRTKAAVFAIIMSVICFSSHVTFADPMDLSQHWAYATMQKFFEREGQENELAHEFDPEQKVTRAEFVDMINLVWPGTLSVISDEKSQAAEEELAGEEMTFSDPEHPENDQKQQEDAEEGEEEHLDQNQNLERSFAQTKGTSEQVEEEKNRKSHINDETVYATSSSTGQVADKALEELITRQEAAYLLVNIKNYTRQSNDFLTQKYIDGDQVSSWAKEAVEIMVQRGILKGYPCGSLRAGAPMTKAEAMTLLKAVEEEEKQEMTFNFDLDFT